MKANNYEDNHTSSQILQYLALSLFALVPIAYGSWTHNPTIIKDLIVAIVGTLLIVASLSSHPLNFLRWQDRKIDICLIIFFAVNILSLFIHPTRMIGYPFIYQLFFLIFFFKYFSSISKKISFNVLYRLNLMGSLIVLLFGIYQIYSGLEKPHSTIGNPNYYGGYLIGVFPLIVMGLRDKNLVWKAVSIITIAFFIVNMYFIRSWAMGLSFIIAIFLMIFLHFQELRQRLICLSLFALGLFMIARILSLGGSLEEQVVNDIRPYIWKGVFELIKGHPMFGCGAGQFIIYYPEYRTQEYFLHPQGVDNTDHAHCEVLEMISETGLIGFITFLVFLFFLLRRIYRTSIHGDSEFKLQIYTILMGVFLLYFENLFDINLRYMSSLFFFWSFLGWCYGMTTPQKTGLEERSFTIKWPFKLIIGMSTMYILAFQFILPFVSETFFKNGIRHRQASKFEEAVSNYQKAVKIWPKHIEAHYRLAYLCAETGKLEQARKSYEKVMELAPHFASVHANLGIVLSRMDRLEEARDQLILQVKMNPFHEKILCSLASVLLRLNQFEEAKKYLKMALVLNPHQEFALRALKELKVRKEVK